MDEALDGALVAQTNPPPPSATHKGPSAGEGTCTTSLDSAGIAVNTPAVQEGARGWGNRSAERVARERTAQREESACEEWINSSRKNVAKLCEVAAKPFWQVGWWCHRVFQGGACWGRGYIGRIMRWPNEIFDIVE